MGMFLFVYEVIREDGPMGSMSIPPVNAYNRITLGNSASVTSSLPSAPIWDVNQMTARQKNTLLNEQLGVYDYFSSMSPSEQMQTLLDAKRLKTNDVGEAVLAPVKDAIRDSEFYADLKAKTAAGSGITSKELKTAALDPNLSPQMKLALSMRADALKKVGQVARQNFQAIKEKIQRGDDPSTIEARKKAEEATLKAMRASFGLDEGSGE